MISRDPAAWKTWNRASINPQQSEQQPTAMPPRLSLLKASSWLSSPSCSPVAPFLVPFLQRPQQQRFASIIGSLSDNPGAYNKKIRRGRGPASGKGKTSGRGHKGQKQHGKVPRGFTGGQTKYEITHPERGLGFENQYVLLGDCKNTR